MASCVLRHQLGSKLAFATALLILSGVSHAEDCTPVPTHSTGEAQVVALAEQVTQIAERLPPACEPIAEPTEDELFTALNQLCNNPRLYSARLAEQLRSTLGFGESSGLKSARQLMVDRMSDLELSSIHAYIGNCYGPINARLRRPEPLTPSEILLFEKIRSAIALLPAHQGTVYRGARLPEEIAQTYRANPQVVERAFTSSSLDQNTARRFAFSASPEQSRIFVIESRTGRQVHLIREGEQEVLFLPGTRFEVTRTEAATPGQSETFHLREIPQDENGPAWGIGISNETFLGLADQVSSQAAEIRSACIHSLRARSEWDEAERECVHQKVDEALAPRLDTALPLSGENPAECQNQRLLHLRIRQRIRAEVEMLIAKAHQITPAADAYRRVTSTLNEGRFAPNWYRVANLALDNPQGASQIGAAVDAQIRRLRSDPHYAAVDWNQVRSEAIENFSSHLAQPQYNTDHREHVLSRVIEEQFNLLRNRFEAIHEECLNAADFPPISESTQRLWLDTWGLSANPFERCKKTRLTPFLQEITRQLDRAFESIPGKPPQDEIINRFQRELFPLYSAHQREAVEYASNVWRQTDLPALREQFAPPAGASIEAIRACETAVASARPYSRGLLLAVAYHIVSNAPAEICNRNGYTFGGYTFEGSAFSGGLYSPVPVPSGAPPTSPSTP